MPVTCPMQKNDKLSPVQQFILLISAPTAKLLEPQPSLFSGGQLCFRVQHLVRAQLLPGLLRVDHILGHLVLLLPDRGPDQGPPPHLRGGGGGDGGGDPDDLPLLLLLLLIVLLLLGSKRTSGSDSSQAEW